MSLTFIHGILDAQGPFARRRYDIRVFKGGSHVFLCSSGIFVVGRRVSPSKSESVRSPSGQPHYTGISSVIQGSPTAETV